MKEYIISLTIFGIATLGMAWMPALSKRIKVSYAVLYTLLGFLLYSFLQTLPEPNPTKENSITLRLTELVVIISLMGTGLRIDEPFSFRRWRVPLKLVSITMMLSISVTAFLGYFLLGFDLPSSILLGAALAPTDPVLASEVQVGPPQDKNNSRVRFSLTAEGGLNDGMAFPFTWLAVALALYPHDNVTIYEWIAEDLAWRIIVGVVAGYLFGKAVAYLVFILPSKGKYTFSADGFVALSLTFVVYGITELLHGYGFLAVFICAVTLRNQELSHSYHLKLHAFMDQIERIMVAMVLILFGGSIANGILSLLNWPMVVFGAASILAIRPLCSYFSVANEPLRPKEKWIISFFGIKGVGSLFYLAFALNEAPFVFSAELWTTVSFVVLCSILVHGFTAPMVMESDLEGEDVTK